MSDKTKGLIVSFEKDLQDGSAERIKHAISMLKGVFSVEKSVTDVDDYLNRQNIKAEFKNDVLELWKKI